MSSIVNKLGLRIKNTTYFLKFGKNQEKIKAKQEYTLLYTQQLQFSTKSDSLFCYIQNNTIRTDLIPFTIIYIIIFHK